MVLGSGLDSYLVCGMGGWDGEGGDTQTLGAVSTPLLVSQYPPRSAGRKAKAKKTHRPTDCQTKPAGYRP